MIKISNPSEPVTINVTCITFVNKGPITELERKNFANFQVKIVTDDWRHDPHNPIIVADEMLVLPQSIGVSNAFFRQFK
jgi:hypothetical protein